MKGIGIAGGVVLAGTTFVAIRKTKLPTAVKTGIILAAGGVGFFGGRKLGKIISPGGSEQNVTAAKTEQQEILKNNLHLPADQQIRATHTKQEMINYANSLEREMKGAGTDDEGLIKTISEAVNNDLDFLNLVEAFGIRDDDDLSTWINDDGATEEANNVLATKSNVSKRF